MSLQKRIRDLREDHDLTQKPSPSGTGRETGSLLPHQRGLSVGLDGQSHAIPALNSGMEKILVNIKETVQLK